MIRNYHNSIPGKVLLEGSKQQKEGGRGQSFKKGEFIFLDARVRRPLYVGQ